MNIRFLMAMMAAVVSMALSLPASAQSKDPFDAFAAINPEVLFKGILREDDVTLLFRHLRESMAAAARGEEAQESEAMKRRTEQIQREVAARGSVLAGLLLSAFESAAKQAVREGLSEFSGKPSAPRVPIFPRSNSLD